MCVIISCGSWGWICIFCSTAAGISVMSKATWNVFPENIYTLLSLSLSFLHICFLHSVCDSLTHTHILMPLHSHFPFSFFHTISIVRWRSSSWSWLSLESIDIFADFVLCPIYKHSQWGQEIFFLLVCSYLAHSIFVEDLQKSICIPCNCFMLIWKWVLMPQSRVQLPKCSHLVYQINL